MLSINISKASNTELQLLCLGAHSDDIEIGCGGTILRYIHEYPQLQIHWIVLGASGPRVKEAQMSAERFLLPVKGRRVIVNKFRDGFFPYIGMEIKEYFEQLKENISPDIIFTHYRADLHK